MTVTGLLMVTSLFENAALAPPVVTVTTSLPSGVMLAVPLRVALVNES